MHKIYETLLHEIAAALRFYKYHRLIAKNNQSIQSGVMGAKTLFCGSRVEIEL